MTEEDYAAELKYLIRHLQKELQALRKDEKAPAPDPISDHAIVRYLERV